MNILLTIKSILKYLYNHLIDLIWTKKIKFADGTELTTAITGGDTFSLFDIKVLSQAIADKGFAFMCKNSRQNLSKNVVPTIYNNILDKYLNVEEVMSPLTEGLNWYQVVGETCHFAFLNGSFYKGKEWVLSFTNNYQSGTYNNITSNIFIRDLITLNNCIIIIGYETINGNNVGFLYKLNPSTNEITKLTGNSQFEDYEYDFNYKVFDGKIYINYCTGTSAIQDKFKKIFIVTDDLTDFTYQTIVANKIVADLTYYDNNFYVLLKEAGTKLVYVRKTNDLNNINSASELWQDYITYENGYEGNEYTEQAQMFNYENNFYLFFKAYQDDFKIVITTNEFVTITKERQYVDYNSATGLQKIRYCENKLYIKIVTSKRFLYSADLSSNAYFVIDDTIKNLDYNFSYLILPNIQFFALNENYSSCNLWYRGISKKVYTDTYIINGNSVTIDYYKYDDFKICISDNGTNDAKLETLYNYLGYLNYWLLDINNETISIQRDKNTYSVMYVGDNFLDTLDNLPINDYAPFVTKKQLIANEEYIINPTTIDNLQDGTKNTVYQANNPTLVIAGKDVNDSDWYLEIQISKNNVDFITIARYGVSNGDPGSSAIMNVIIGGGLYWKVVTSLTTGNIKYGEIN